MDAPRRRRRSIFQVNEGYNISNSSRGWGVIQQKYGKEEDEGTMMKIVGRVIVVILSTSPIPPHDLRPTPTPQSKRKYLMIGKEMG